ncbi:unnamed protein product [Caenorhabditis sp. 36 PRJEB53466]|nr:unnamed protein product [Caenorhabditis sp. 36 PRJEB53466]
MRPDIVAFLLFLGHCDGFQPVKISIRKSEKRFEATTEDPDAYNSYDPFDLNDASFFSDVTNSSKRIKLQLETAQFIQKFGAQELLNIILRKVQNVNLPQDSKGAINSFLDFVEDLIYSNAAERIEQKLKMDMSQQASGKRKLHMGEATTGIEKEKTEYGDAKDHRRRDAPALAQNAVLIDADENYPAVRQPLEPTKLMFFTHNNEPNFLREESVVSHDIRKSPGNPNKRRTRLTKTQLEKAIKSAEREARELEMEKILKRRRVQLKAQQRQRKERELTMKRKRASKKLPLSKIEARSTRRSPLRGQVTFNEKMFQLLDEYGIKSFRVETADYTVRAYADPERTRFSSINLLDVPEYNETIRRKPARPPFVYSRSIQAPKRSMILRSLPSKRTVQEKKMRLERLL